MKNNFLRTALILAMGFILNVSYGQTRDLDSFDKIDASSGVKVHLIQANNHKVDITMKKGDVDDVITEVRNGTLYLKYKKNGMFNWGNKTRAEFEVYYTNLEGIEVSSGSTLTAENEIAANTMEIEVSSGSSCTIDLVAEKVEAEVSSGSTLRIKGETSNLELEISSGSTFSGQDFRSDEVSVEASSGSTAKVWAVNRIQADASSGSSIKYKGNPDKKSLKAGKYSGGSIREM